ncbi:MAG: hypothetical protein L6Q92_04185 [Phycisphaerae bacterium]|nr:hypothetical protein [Phycisphaerae bacterium]
MRIDVVAAAANGLAVTAPNTAVTSSGVQTVTWDVARSAGGEINCTSVRIRLSTEGGLTWPMRIAMERRTVPT